MLVIVIFDALDACELMMEVVPLADEKNVADKAKKSKETPKDKKDKKDKKRVIVNVQKIFWVAIIILIFLLILSLVVLSTLWYNYTKIADDSRTIKIVADDVLDFDIFSAEYYDDEGFKLMGSMDGENIIGPGASTEYDIRIFNDDDVALNYTFSPVVDIKIPDEYEFPLRLKLLSPDGKYLIGDNKTWGTFEDFANLKDYTATLPVGEMHKYRLEWEWPFDEDDDRDTALSAMPEDMVSISVGMNLHSEQNLSAEANGTFFDFGVGNIFILTLFFVLLLIAIILLLISIIRRQAGEPQVVYVPTPTPVPTPAPAPAPKPAAPYVPKPIVNKKKAKGFVGKMEYVNIDTLVEFFNSGDTITLSDLKAKGLVDPKATQVKILARGDAKLNKIFHIETQGISAQARKTVVEAGGTVKIIDG